MTEERFEDLINLYLDNEIGRHELDELKRVIKENLVRRKQFERACQLHQAARKALVGRMAEEGNVVQTRNTTGAAGRSSARPASQPSSSEKQERAFINATVPLMAERQTTQGAASSVKLSEVSTGRRRRSGHKDSIHSIATVKNLMYLGVMAVAALVGFHFFGPTTGDSDFSSYTPDVSALPAMPSTDKGSDAIAQLSDLPDDASQPFDVTQFISARMMATAMTGNTVTQQMLIKLITTHAEIPNAANGTNLSINVTEQLFFKSGTLNVPPPMTEQLQRALPGMPPLAPGRIDDGVLRTTTTTIEVTSPGNGAAGVVKAAGNNTLGQDLQP